MHLLGRPNAFLAREQKGKKKARFETNFRSDVAEALAVLENAVRTGLRSHRRLALPLILFIPDLLRDWAPLLLNI